MDVQKKHKLSFNERIEHMHNTKGIAFSIVNKTDAHVFLSNHNYYFRVKSYAKNHEHYSDENSEQRGKYIDLEFAYLKELSILDMHFKNITHKILTAIEHYTKIFLLKSFEEDNEDGYKIVKDFFNHYKSHNNHILSRIVQNKNGYCGDLIRKCCPTSPVTISNQKFALWNVIEVLSFGDLIKLFSFYVKNNSNHSKNTLHITNLLWSARMLRNAITHDNCLLNSLKDGYSNDNFTKNKQLNTFIQRQVPAISTQTRKQQLSNPVIHDFVATLYLFNEIVTSEEVKRARMEELGSFIYKRCLLHKGYFGQNTIIISNYCFIKNFVDFQFK